MRILSVIVDLNKGGAEINFYRLNAYFKKQGHDILVICLSKNGFFSKKLNNINIDVLHLNLSLNFNIFKKLYFLFKSIKNFKPDIVQTWMYHSNIIGGILAKIAGVKFINWNIRHGSFKFGSTKLTTIFFIFLNSLFSHFIPNQIVFNSNSSKKFHNNIFFSKKKNFIIHNGIDTNLYKPLNKNNNLLNSLEISKDLFLIGMFARSSPQKDHLTLIQAVNILINKKNYFNLHCMLIGKSITKNEIVLNEIVKYKLKKYFTLVDHTDSLIDYYNLLDIHILCSNYGESFSNSILEAMSCGIPSISTNVGDVTNLINNKNLICEVKNYKSLIKSIDYLIKLKKDKKKWDKIKLEVRNNINQNYHQNIMFKKYSELINVH